MIENQIKNLAWNTFKQTGDINTFMEFMQIKNMDNIIQNKMEEKDQNIQQNL